MDKALNPTHWIKGLTCALFDAYLVMDELMQTAITSGTKWVLSTLENYEDLERTQLWKSDSEELSLPAC